MSSPPEVVATLGAPLARALGRALGSAPVRVRSLSGGAGGDINQAWAVWLDDGRAVFAKSNRDAPPGMFACEAHGLEWLADAGALRVPAVLAVGEDAPDAAFLALELLTPGRRREARPFDESLGRGLARLHRAGADGFGLARDNYIATLPQDNTPADAWPTFYARRRLEPLVRRVVDDGLVPAGIAARFDRLFGKLPALCGPAEPAARLHGDLWHGNVHTGPDGEPCLIDPAVYGGHREVDLAMLALFGGVSATLLAAYDEVWPHAPGRADRVPLYQLYPLLVHVALFGGAYAGQLASALARYA